MVVQGPIALYCIVKMHNLTAAWLSLCCLKIILIPFYFFCQQHLVSQIEPLAGQLCLTGSICAALIFIMIIMRNTAWIVKKESCLSLYVRHYYGRVTTTDLKWWTVSHSQHFQTRLIRRCRGPSALQSRDQCQFTSFVFLDETEHICVLLLTQDETSVVLRPL